MWGGTTSVTNSGAFTTADANAAALTSVGAFSQTGGGTSSLGSNITTTNTAISFLNSIVLTDPVSLSTQSGAGLGSITLSSTVDGTVDDTEGLTLVSGTGDILVSGAVGGTKRLGAITVTSAKDASFASSVKALSLTQVAGTGTTSFNGSQDYTANFSFTGKNLTVNALWHVGGTTSVTNSGAFTTADANAAALTSVGAFSQTGGGNSSLGSNITTTNTAIGFLNSIVLTDPVSLSTQSAAGLGSITLSSTVDGTADDTESLTLVSGTGDILVSGAVGGTTRLGAITITSAKDATFSSSVKALSLTQVAGTGTTSFNGSQNYTANFSFTGKNITVNALWHVGGTTSVTNSGAFTTADANAAALTSVGAFSQTGGGTSSLGSNITTTNTAIGFLNSIVLTDPVSLSTQSGAGLGSITLSSTVDGTTDDTEGLTLVSGTGDILVSGAVGGTKRLGAITVTSAKDATFSSSVKALSLTQVAGTGTTSFNGSQDYTANFSFTGKNLTVNALWHVGGTTSVTNSGAFTTADANAAALTSVGAFSQTGGGNSSLGSNITTTNTAIGFLNRIVLTDPVSLSTQGGAGLGSITLSSTVDGTVDDTEGLTLVSGTGDILVSGAVGGTTRLGAITVTSAKDASFSSSVKALSLTQVAGTGTTSFNGSQDYTANFSFTGKNLTVNALWHVGGTTSVTNSGAFTTADANAAALTSVGAFSQTGGGNSSLGSNITTTNTAIGFLNSIVLTDPVSLSTQSAAGLGSITLSSTVDGTVDDTEGLTLVSGTGDILVSGAVGGTTRLGAITVTSAKDASFSSSVKALSLTQVAGTGTTSFNGSQDYTTNFAFTGVNLTVNALWQVGGTTSVTNSGAFTTADANAAALTSVGAFSQTGGGNSSLGSNITTTNTAIGFLDEIVLTDPVSLSTQSGAGLGSITLLSTVDGTVDDTESLTLVSGTGDILVSGAVGSTKRLGAITVTSAKDASFSSSVKSLSLTQVAGTGTTSFNGSQDYTANFSFTGKNLTVNALWHVGGTTSVTNSGAFTTADANAAALTSVGAFSQTGGGNSSLGSNITTTNTAIGFLNSIVLTDPVSLSTQSGAGLGSITLSSTVDGTLDDTEGLTLVSGTGDILVSGAVGGTKRLGAITVTSAKDATFSSSVKALSLTQVAGTGTTSFNGSQDYTANFSFTGKNLTVNALWQVGGTTSVTNSGAFTTADANAAALTSVGAFSQTGGGNSSLGSNITTTNTAIGFLNSIVLTDPVSLSTQSAAGLGSITLSSTVDGTVDDTEGLTLVSGTGDILVSGAVGGTTRLGAITVTSAKDASFSSSVKALSLTQVAGTGTTSFNGSQDYTANFSFTGKNLTVNALWHVGGTTSVTNSGAFTTADANAAALTSVGAFSQSGGGTSSLGSNITTTNTAIGFLNSIVLTDPVSLSTQSGAGLGSITLSSTVDGTVDDTEGLTLVSGTGDILVSGAVGGTTRLGAITVTSAKDASFASSVKALSLTQVAGTGTTSFNGSQNYTANFSFTGKNLTVNALWHVGGTTSVTNSGAFTTADANAAALTSVGAFSQTGGGNSSLGSNITTTNTAIGFLNSIVLTDPVSLSTQSAAGLGSITLSSTVDGTVDDTESLTLVSGTGDILVSGAVGSTKRLGAITVTSAKDASFSSSVKALSLTQVAGTGTTSFNGSQDYTANFSFTGKNLTVNALWHVGGTTSVINSGAFTTADANAAALTSVGAFSQTGGGNSSLGSNITTTNTAIGFLNSIVLTDPVSLSTQSAAGLGSITLSSTVDGTADDTESLTLVSGTGDILVSGAVGGTKRLGAITVTSAKDASFASSVKALSLTQVAGTGTTSFNGSQDYTVNFSFTGKNLTVNALWQVGGTTSVINSGAFTTADANAAALTSVGAFSQTGGGNSSLGSNITTTNTAIGFLNSIVLTDPVSLSTQSGAGLGSITLSSTVDGTVDDTESLTLVSGTGDILVSGAVGSTKRLGAITITSAKDATFSSSVKALSLTQVAGTGTTSFNGSQDYTANFSFTGKNLTVNALWHVGGTTSVTNSGAFTTADANAAALTSVGAFSQSGGGTSSLGSNITTTNTAIGFLNSIVLTDPVSLSTQSAAGLGSITLSSTVDGTVDDTEGLTLVSGTGDILVSGAVGSTKRLGAITVTSAKDASFASSVKALSLTQVAGTGTTSFNGSQDYTANFSFTGKNLTVNALWHVGGTTSVTNSGAFTTADANAAALTSVGAFSQTGGGNSSLGSNITTTNTAIGFLNSIVLTDPVSLSTQSGAGLGSITLSSTIDGTVDDTEGLTLISGTGDILVSGAVGGTTRLGAITVTSAKDASFASSVKALSLTQVAGTGTTSFNGSQDYTANFSFTGKNLTVNALWHVGGTTSVTNSGAFTTADANAAALTSVGAFSQSGGGTSSLGSNITTTNTAIGFLNSIVLTDPVSLSTQSAAGLGSITLSSTVDGTVDDTEGLTLVSGTGDITARISRLERAPHELRKLGESH